MKKFRIPPALFPADSMLHAGGQAPDEPPEDGGIRDRSDSSAAKRIQSDEITDFSWTISAAALAEQTSLGDRSYRLHAWRDGEPVLGSYEAWNDAAEQESWEFTATEDFLMQLNSLIKCHDLARFNGTAVTVEGLPPGYGTELTVLYASGEKIYVHHNQEGILDLDAAIAAEALFRSRRPAETLPL